MSLDHSYTEARLNSMVKCNEGDLMYLWYAELFHFLCCFMFGSDKLHIVAMTAMYIILKTVTEEAKVSMLPAVSASLHKNFR